MRSRQETIKKEAGMYRAYCAPQVFEYSNWPFIRDTLWRMNSALWPAIMSEYVRICNEAAAEAKQVKRQNHASAAGNVFMRESDTIMRSGGKRAKDLSLRLRSIMRDGPLHKCSTCKYWEYEVEGEYFQGCRKGEKTDGVHSVCEHWRSRV